MTATLVDAPAPRAAGRTSSSSDSHSPADYLRGITAAVRVAFTWFGTRKTLSPEQKAEAADTFGAEGNYLSAAKKLLDTKHPAFRAVTSVRHQILSYWKGNSLPYPEPGIRLIRQDDIGAFNMHMTTHKADLDEAISGLNIHYAELKATARDRLGRLYNASDYPASLTGLFDVTWDFPSVEPPSYLSRLSPELYQQESERVAARFDEAVRLAEEAFLAELDRLISHLTERLSGQEDGKPKVFRDSAIENLTEFFGRFRRLNIRSNEQLEQLVDQVQGAVRGIEPQSLRNDMPLRQRVVNQLSGIQSVVDGLLVDRPRRNILRRPR
ncbi:MAG: hypothetical protein HY290_02495 [Planctomycetia bacterium]|nr:hypothetical protein [Planctomycetia bacterium]